MAKKLKREQLIELVDNVMHPKGRGFTSQELNDQLLSFCINCPDPAAAMDLVVEAVEPMTAAQLVNKALAYPIREAASLPESELAMSHPLRHMKLES
jgi:hypothetical protein